MVIMMIMQHDYAVLIKQQGGGEQCKLRISINSLPC